VKTVPKEDRQHGPTLKEIGLDANERRALRLFAVLERLAPLDTGDPASIVSGAGRVRPSQFGQCDLIRRHDPEVVGGGDSDVAEAVGPAGSATRAVSEGIVRWSVTAVTAWLPAMALVEPLHGLTFALLHLACMQMLLWLSRRPLPRQLRGSMAASPSAR
jgi:hypothetical protein